MDTTETTTASVSADAAPPPTPRPSQEDLATLRRTGQLLTILWIFQLGAQAYLLPFKIFLKNEMGLTALGVSTAMFFGATAWKLKWVVAWFCDNYPIAHRRRVPYVVLGATVAILGYAGLVVMPRTVPIVTAMIGISQLGLVFSSCSLGGLMVETGNRAGNLAKLSSIRGTLWNGSVLVTGPLAGWLAGRWIGLTCGFFSSCCVLLILVMVRVKEPAVTETTHNPVALIWDTIKALFLHRNFWFAIGACVLLNCAPGFGTPLLFFQTNVLKFSTQTIGNFGLVGGAFAILSGSACIALSNRWPLKRLIVVATIINATLTLAYLQYNSLPHAIVIEGINGFINAPSQIVIFLIAGYATPRGYEAIGYAIMMTVANFVTDLNDMFGSYLSTSLHWPFAQLVWVNALTTLAILLMVPFMPKTMLLRKDKE